MSPNIKWEFENEFSLLHAHGGWEYGDTLEEVLPKLRLKKAHDAASTARILTLGADDVLGEIGPGFGLEAATNAEKVKHIHLFEISSSFQKICMKTVQAKNVSFHLMDPNDLSSMRGKEINKIYSGGVFIHFNTFDLYLYLKQISEILPIGGKLLFNFRNILSANATSKSDWISAIQVYKKDKTAIFGLMYWHSPETIRAACHDVGFMIESVIYPDSDYTYVLCVKR